MKSVKVVFAAAVVTAVGFARADATTESRTAGAVVRFGVVTDLHCADLDTADHTRFVPVAGKTHYRESLRKLEKAVAALNARGVDFMIELGDFKDFTKNRETTLPILDRAEAEFAKFNGPRYHVLGNHDMDCLTKAEFFAHVKNYDAASGRHANPTNGYYSFERNGIMFVVLDACYTKDGADYEGPADGRHSWKWYEAKVPDAELAWLEATLKAAPGPVVVFCHQRLDPKAWNVDNPKLTHAVINAADVRAVLEKSRKVKAVFTGHEHTGGVCNLNGIAYHSLVAMAINGTADETNSFAEVAVYPSGDVSVTEFQGGEAELAKGTAPPLRIRQVRFDVGARRPFSVLHVSDSHLTGVDERDGPAVRAFARSRENLGRELGASYLEEALGYARARGLRVVHTGDVIEYASAANFSRAGELVRANDILACVGNHEFWKTGKSWDEAAKRPLAESVGAAFPGEQPAFSCETNGVSLFVFDNAFGRVSPAVTSAFERVVAKGLPVVLVCHVPFPAKDLLDRPFVRDYLLGEGAAGTDATTKAFVPRVRNEPLVRAVLCGHLHEFSHTRLSPTAEMCVANALFNGEAVEVTFR